MASYYLKCDSEHSNVIQKTKTNILCDILNQIMVWSNNKEKNGLYKSITNAFVSEMKIYEAM